jgi:hypothetical protein
VAEKSLLLSEKSIEQSDVRVDPDDPDVVMEVWVKDLSFLDIQRAAQEMLIVNDGVVGFSLEGYWKHAFTHWVVETNPSLTPDEMLRLTGFAGEQLSKVLPQPNDIAEAMQGDFRDSTETK